ncbi:TrkA family potassium uptake protein [Salinirubellus salinus]|uniref:TrkA family potassium uptake protein n=1 Tax=Salinirubellus salinus TaxID=1364945 RepID=A0A9E7R968_9EURY|nr:TrkA family potassium uptake protein [Salinirubellus salinus]UWM56768.1 TrkA family potassium uptake protein [Salinirubellus salinus]
MTFVIVGYGRVGKRTADILRSEGHDLVVVERDEDKAAAAAEAGFDVVVGDGEDERVLEEAGIAEADALAALTGDLNANFAVCMIGKGYGCRTVLRIDEDYRQEIYEKYAADVDEIVYPERMGAAGAKTALLGGDLNVLADLTEHLTAATVTVPEDSPHVGRRVVELELPDDARLYAHGSANEPLTIPMPRTVLQAGDRVAVIAERESLEAVRAMLGGEEATA